MIDPASKMLIVRLLHAFLSLATIWFGYRMVRMLAANPCPACGILLAFYWFQPWLSVRNLVEVACIPFLIGGTYYAMLPDRRNAVYLGSFSPSDAGPAFNIRYQTMSSPVALSWPCGLKEDGGVGYSQAVHCF
jgi:hypothetical protein